MKAKNWCHYRGIWTIPHALPNHMIFSYPFISHSTEKHELCCVQVLTGGGVMMTMTAPHARHMSLHVGRQALSWERTMQLHSSGRGVLWCLSDIVV